MDGGPHFRGPFNELLEEFKIPYTPSSPNNPEIEMKYVIFGLWLIGSIASPVIHMKWKFRQISNRNESGDETEKITGIEPEIDTIRNLQVNFDNRKEVKEKVECDKDIKDCNLECECDDCSYQTNTKIS